MNNEFSIGCADPALVREVRTRLFEADFQRSEEVNGQPVESPGDVIMNALIRSPAGQL